MRTRVRNQYAHKQLVLNALRHPQPVEVTKERSDVVMALRANCQACGSVDDGLHTVQQVAAWQAGESDVAVVHVAEGLQDSTLSISAADKGEQKRRAANLVKIRTYATQHSLRNHVALL